MSISSIQSKYPNAVWYDSNHGGTNSGTLDNPYTSLATAMTNATDSVAILNGTHSEDTQVTLPKSLTLVGESTGAILSTAGSLYGGAITARGTAYSIKLENLKVYHNSTSTTYSLIDCGNVASASVSVEGCILEMGPSTLSASGRGWFGGGATPITSLTISDSVILGGTSSSIKGVIVGGDQFQDAYNALDFQRNTIVITGGSSSRLLSYSAGILSFTFKNNIFVGNGNSETIGATPTTASNNCYHNNGISSGSGGVVFADPLFIDPANADFRLRPTSPCINAGTSS
jgi:hypothetical protein